MLPEPLRHAYAVLVVMVGWVFFRADTLGSAAGDARGHGGRRRRVTRRLRTSVVLDHRCASRHGRRRRGINAGDAGTRAARWLLPPRAVGALTLRWHGSMAALLALTTLLAVSLMLSAARSYNPFIYFRF